MPTALVNLEEFSEIMSEGKIRILRNCRYHEKSG